MKRTKYITLLIVMLVIIPIICSGCPNGVSIGRANYEAHGVYYKGKLMPTFKEADFYSMTDIFNQGNPERQEVKIALQKHKHRAIKMPRKFVLELWPDEDKQIVIFSSLEINGQDPIVSLLEPKIVGNKKVGQVEIILNRGYCLIALNHRRDHILIKY